MHCKPDGQPSHFCNYNTILPGNQGNYATSGYAFMDIDNAGKVPGSKKFGDVAMNRNKTIIENTLEQLRGER